MRDTRKGEKYFKGFLKYIEDDIEDDVDYLENTPKIKPLATVNIPWALYQYYIKKMEIDYCLGVEIPSFSENVNIALDWLQSMNDYGAKLQDREDQEYFAQKKELTQNVLFFHHFWLSFALGVGLEVKRITQAMELIGQAGEDRFMDLVMVQLGQSNRKVASKVRHPIIFQGLVDIIDAESQERPGLMKAYLEKWLDLMKKEGFKESHKKEEFYYTGYWCYASALVVMLWDIDDSSFRNNPYYPKDLVRKL
jgi:hypothetical protein